MTENPSIFGVELRGLSTFSIFLGGIKCLFHILFYLSQGFLYSKSVHGLTAPAGRLRPRAWTGKRLQFATENGHRNS